MKAIKFNLNGQVRVKLTDAGRSHFLQWQKNIFGKHWKASYARKLEEDSEGWSVWPMHELMNVFGEMMHMENTVNPFNMNVEILVDGGDRDD